MMVQVFPCLGRRYRCLSDHACRWFVHDPKSNDDSKIGKTRNCTSNSSIQLCHKISESPGFWPEALSFDSSNSRCKKNTPVLFKTNFFDCLGLYYDQANFQNPASLLYSHSSYLEFSPDFSSHTARLSESVENNFFFWKNDLFPIYFSNQRTASAFPWNGRAIFRNLNRPGTFRTAVCLRRLSLEYSSFRTRCGNCARCLYWRWKRQCHFDSNREFSDFSID